MPTNKVSMRRIRETLRLHLQAGLSYNEVGRTLKISKNGLDRQPSLFAATDSPVIEHENVRGPDCYH